MRTTPMTKCWMLSSRFAAARIVRKHGRTANLRARAIQIRS